ncbi:hypothetical protein D3C75_895720 [compost metagenome]
MGCTIDLRRLLQTFRDTVEEGNQNNHIEWTNETRQDKRPDRIQQMEIADENVIGDDAPAEEHCDDDDQHEPLASPQLFFG